MKRVVLGIVFGILLLGVFGVLAENNDTNVTDSNETLSCDSDNLGLCLSEDECTGAGGYWYSDVCNEDEEEVEGNETETNEVEETEEGEENQHMVKTREAKRITFTPWQKRDESECLEGCKCVGAVMSCHTETGKIMTITAGRSGNTIVITIDKTEVETELEIEAENDTDGEKNNTKLKAKMSNGQIKEIKIMPDAASKKALQRLRLKNCVEEEGCTLELKEVGSGKDKQLAYELQAERHSRILWMFRKKMEVKAQIDAETGELIRVKKPWWAFLAAESEE